MNKQTTLESIKNARKIHEIQMAKIKAAMNGQKVNNPTPVSKTKCDFGHWLYKEESHLRNILGSFFYDNIELNHTQWHNEYIRIHKIYFQEEQKGIFSKILGNCKVSTKELDKAKLYYSELEVTTQKLLKFLGASQRRVEALPESKFQ